MLAAGLYWSRRDRRTFDPWTRTYVQLRTATARAGLGVGPGLTPLALVERIQQERGQAGAAAGRIVDLYLRARYGREALGESELREMREALAVARRLLRG